MRLLKRSKAAPANAGTGLQTPPRGEAKSPHDGEARRGDDYAWTFARAANPPRPLRHELSHPQPFPLDLLGDVLGDAARAIVDKVQCADALAGSSVLAVASLATQAHADVVIPATGQARPLSLFLVSVASSGERKTAADAEALRPIREWEKILRGRYDDDHRKFKQAKLGTARPSSGREKPRAALKRFSVPSRLSGISLLHR